MHRTIQSTFVLGLTTLFPYAFAGFGFTSASFANVELSQPQVISWNGQYGNIELRLMVYPADQDLDYIPLQSNLSGDSWTWLPTALSPGSTWTLEGIDSQGNLATSGTSFTVTGTAASSPNSSTTSYMQQNPAASTAQPSTIGPSAAASATSQTPAAQSTNQDGFQGQGSSNEMIPGKIKYAIWLAVLIGVLGIGSLAAFFVLRYRQKRGKDLLWRPRSQRRTSSSLPFELNANESMESLQKPMELQGSHVEGNSETSWGSRTELGWTAAPKEGGEKRISMATGAVETSMGKRMELA